VQSTDPVERCRSLKVLATRYWKAIYKYVRLRWRKEPLEAEEITQEFFLRAVDKNALGGYDARQARFRTFVRVRVDGLVIDWQRHHRAKKRGGGASIHPLDFTNAEEELSDEASGIVDPEELFRAEWVKSLLQAALQSLRAKCKCEAKGEHFRAFELFHLREHSYDAIATELGISVRDVDNRLAYARREFRGAVLEALRECTGSEQEMHEEAQSVLGLRF